MTIIPKPKPKESEQSKRSRERFTPRPEITYKPEVDMKTGKKVIKF